MTTISKAARLHVAELVNAVDSEAFLSPLTAPHEATLGAFYRYRQQTSDVAKEAVAEACDPDGNIRAIPSMLDSLILPDDEPTPGNALVDAYVASQPAKDANDWVGRFTAALNAAGYEIKRKDLA